jgi:hypothetical protein
MSQEFKREVIKALGEYTVKKGKRQRDEILESDDEIDANLLLNSLNSLTTPEEIKILFNEHMRVSIFFYFL